jgi:hypothetical protein
MTSGRSFSPILEAARNDWRGEPIDLHIGRLFAWVTPAATVLCLSPA